MTNERRLRVGVAGVGGLGQWHARIFSELPQTELCGVYDLDRDQAQRIADRYKTRVFSGLDELASQVDAASVAVPAPWHRTVALPLIEQGIHLLIEKPLAVTLADGEALVTAAEKAGIVLQVGHVERFNPVMDCLESHLDRPRFIETQRLATYPPPRAGLPPRGTEIGVVLDLMVHDLEIVLHLIRSPVRDVQAIGAAVLSPEEDIANARLLFENGCVANLTASRVSRDRVRKIRVFQADAYMSLDFQDQSGHMVRKSATGLETTALAIEKAEPLQRELSAFSDCVLRNRPPQVGGRTALEALKWALTIAQRIREGNA